MTEQWLNHERPETKQENKSRRKKPRGIVWNPTFLRAVAKQFPACASWSWEEQQVPGRPAVWSWVLRCRGGWSSSEAGRHAALLKHKRIGADVWASPNPRLTLQNRGSGRLTISQRILLSWGRKPGSLASRLVSSPWSPCLCVAQLFQSAREGCKHLGTF